MQITEEQLLLWVGSVIWPFVRITAMLLAAPIFGSRSLNARARLSFGLLLAILVSPLLDRPPPIDPLSVAGMLIVAREVAIGLAMGLVLQMVFAALAQAGEIIALSMGLGFASSVDPAAGVQVPMVSQLLVIATTLIFLALNGHLVLIELLVRSFRALPVGTGGLSPDDLWALVGFGSTMFAGAVLVSLPVMASLLLVNLALGVVSRAAPQIQIFSVGFIVMILSGFLLLVVTLPALPARIGELMMAAFALIQHFLQV